MSVLTPQGMISVVTKGYAVTAESTATGNGTPVDRAAAVAQMKSEAIEHPDLFGGAGSEGYQKLMNDFTLLNGDLLGQDLPGAQGFDQDWKTMMSDWNAAIDSTAGGSKSSSSETSSQPSKAEETKKPSQDKATSDSTQSNRTEHPSEEERNALISKFDTAAHDAGSGSFTTNIKDGWNHIKNDMSADNMEHLKKDLQWMLDHITGSDGHYNDKEKAVVDAVNNIATAYGIELKADKTE